MKKLLLSFALLTPLPLFAADSPKAPAAQNAARPWIEALKAPDPGRRRQAVVTLARMGPAAREAVGPLLEVLQKDTNEAVRGRACFALARIQPTSSEVVKALTRTLKEDKDEDVQDEAARALGMMGPAARAAIPALLEVFKAPKRNDVDTVAYALGQIGTPEVLPPLMAVMRSGDGNRQRMAMEALVQVGPPAAPSLVAVLADKDTGIRLLAVEALYQIHPSDTATVAALTKRLQDPDQRIRHYAVLALSHAGPQGVQVLCKTYPCAEEEMRKAIVQALGSLGRDGRAAAPTLRAALSDRSGSIRVLAAEALWHVSGQAGPAVDTLIQAITRTDRAVRRQAIEALGRFGRDARAAIPTLIVTVLKSSEPTLRQAAVDALRQMDPRLEDTAPVFTELLQDGSEGVRLSAAEGLVAAGHDGSQVVRTLTAILRSREPAAGTRAAGALAKLGPRAKAAVPELVAGLRETRIDEGPAIVALGAIGPQAKEAVPVLIPRLFIIRRCSNISGLAAQALVRIGPAAVPDLVKALNASSSLFWNKIAIINVLQTMGPQAKEAAPALQELLQGKDQGVREAAQRALKAVTAVPVSQVGCPPRIPVATGK
jgi:HEAT repeat protein